MTPGSHRMSHTPRLSRFLCLPACPGSQVSLPPAASSSISSPIAPTAAASPARGHDDKQQLHEEVEEVVEVSGCKGAAAARYHLPPEAMGHDPVNDGMRPMRVLGQRRRRGRRGGQDADGGCLSIGEWAKEGWVAAHRRGFRGR